MALARMSRIALALPLAVGVISVTGNAIGEIVSISPLDVVITNQTAQGIAYTNGVLYPDARATDGTFGSVFATPLSRVFDPEDSLWRTTPARLYGNGPTFETSGKVSGSALSLNTDVNALTTWAGSQSSLSQSSVTDESSPVYYGIKFSNDGTTFNYGWLEVQATSSGSSSSIQLLAAAVETTPDLGIKVGVVPEPSTCAVALAAIACGGSMLFRRRSR